MKIGIDCIALQSDNSRNRGVGNYVKCFLEELLKVDDEHEYVFYVYNELPLNYIPAGDWVVVWERLDYAVKGNPDNLDLLLLTSAYESFVDPDCGIPRICSIVYDLIPLIFHEQYLKDEWFRDYYLKHLRSLAQYGKLFAISESTRSDFMQLLGIPERRIETIGIAPAVTLKSGQSLTRSEWKEKPFILHVGGDDIRKGGLNLLKGFSLIPNSQDYNLIFVYKSSQEHCKQLHDHAKLLNVENNFYFLQNIDDYKLNEFYWTCDLFVFPSDYEGGGLPLLEAMSWGAPIIAGNNSSQVELVKDVGLLTDNSPEKLAEGMYNILNDEPLRKFMKRRSMEKGKEFSWNKVVSKFLGSINRWFSKPKLAMFSPIPPIKSGISDYTIKLADKLEQYYDVTIFYDPSITPNLNSFQTKPANKFNPKIYDRVLYHMGNSVCHRYMYEYIRDYPGIVMSHDIILDGFFREYPELDKNFLVGSLGHLTHTTIPFGVDYRDKDPYLLPINFSRFNIVVPGWLSPIKYNRECIEAISNINDNNVELWFVGEGDTSELKKYSEELGIDTRVHFTGWVPYQEYLTILQCANLGLVLRQPPTNGETSAALFDLMSYGIPCIVSDVGSMWSLSNSIVWKTSSPLNVKELTHFINGFIDYEAPRIMGDHCQKYVRENHSWEQCAKKYYEEIEKIYENRI